MECFKLLAIDICCHTNKFLVWKCYCCCLIMLTINVYRPIGLNNWLFLVFILAKVNYPQLLDVGIGFFCCSCCCYIYSFHYSLLLCRYNFFSFFLFFLICLLQHDVHCNFKGLYRHHHYHVWIWFFFNGKKIISKFTLNDNSYHIYKHTSHHQYHHQWANIKMEINSVYKFRINIWNIQI